MANQAAKKRKIENEKQIKKLQIVIAAVNAFYVLYRILWGWSDFSNWHIFGFVCTSIIYGLGYVFLSSVAKPTYDEDGELASGGEDLSMKTAEYFFDAIYITAIVQVTTAIISDKFWYLYIVAFGYLFFVLYNSVLKPFFFSGGNQPEVPEDPKAKAKREKKEKQQQQPKIKYSRAR